MDILCTVKVRWHAMSEELGSAVFALQVISSFLVNFLPEKRPLIHWVCRAMLECSLAIHTHTHKHIHC